MRRRRAGSCSCGIHPSTNVSIDPVGLKAGAFVTFGRSPNAARAILQPPRGRGEYKVAWVQTTASQASIPSIETDIGVDSLATALKEALPGGGQVAVRGRDPQGGLPGSSSDGAESHLSMLAERLLVEPPPSEVALH